MPHSFFEEPLQGKSNKTPFMVFIGRAQGLVHFSNATIKIHLPFTFQLGYGVSSPCSKTAVFSKNAFKLLPTVAFSAPSCLYFRELTVCWALSAHPKKNQKKKAPNAPKFPSLGCFCTSVTLASGTILCTSPGSSSTRGAEPRRRGKTPLPALTWPHDILLCCLKGSRHAFLWDEAGMFTRLGSKLQRDRQ